jgi:hypothetical protein
MKWTRHLAGMMEMRNVYNILGGKPDVKRPLGRCRHRWENNIKIYLDWSHLAEVEVQ